MRLTTGLLLRRALLHRRARLAVALTCLTISAALVTALLSLYADVGDKLNRDFRAFGPNAVVTARDGGALPADAAASLQHQAGTPLETLASASVVADAGGNPVAVFGTGMAHLATMHPEWKLTPVFPAPAGVPACFGARVMQSLGGGAVTLTLGARQISVAPACRLESGGAEDGQIYLDSPAFANWTGLQPTTLEVRIPGSADAINHVLLQTQQALPALAIHPVRQLVDGQSHIVNRTRSLMLLSAAIVVATIAIAVLATLSAMVLDRRRDYAIMKALGCSAATLHRLFLLETAVLATGGALLGLGLGLLGAFLVGEASFHTRVALHPKLWPAAFAVNLAVAALAASLPLRRMTAIHPAALLRGE